MARRYLYLEEIQKLIIVRYGIHSKDKVIIFLENSNKQAFFVLHIKEKDRILI
jgi:hypothetical protein